MLYTSLVVESTSPYSAPALPCARVVVRACISTDEIQQPKQLLPGEIHLWHASPKTVRLNEAYAKSVLSADETERMDRFHFDKDRQNFLFCRSMLRMMLASYLGALPAELVFAYSAHGKPSLAKPKVCLDFNLSHSSGNVLIATCLQRKIGVDLEWVRHDLDVREIAQRFFSAAENKALKTMPISSCYDTFFAGWTRKEAFVKARGEGLSCPLSSFDVSVDPRDEQVTLATRPDATEAGNWQMWSLNNFPGFAAAVAVERKSELQEPQTF